jgi:hypothetical protein
MIRLLHLGGAEAVRSPGRAVGKASNGLAKLSSSPAILDQSDERMRAVEA